MSDIARILLVDDDEGLLKLLKMRLVSGGYIVETAKDGLQCLQKLDVFEPDILISDLRMDHIDGMTLFEEVSSKKPFLPVIIITAHGTIPEAVEATQKGVFSFLTKPIEKDKLFAEIQKALSQSGERPGVKKSSWMADFVAQSQSMKDLLRKSKIAAQSNSNLVIQGDRGTGKELLANSIHKGSKRSLGPFVTVSCSAKSNSALEDELFGRQKNLGAEGVCVGAFLRAKGGTLFLDDVESMSNELQLRILRVIESGKFTLAGSNHPTGTDVRIIVSTTADLKTRVDSSLFREDLFYKLNVIGLSIPSLEERREDIPILAKTILKKVASRQKPRVKSFSPKALELICNAKWPGNVSQLHGFVERLVVLNTTSVISESSVRDELMPNCEELRSLADAKSEFERQYLIKVLRLSNGNVSQAARSAKRNRTDFYKLMARHKLQPSHFKSHETVGLS